MTMQTRQCAISGSARPIVGIASSKTARAKVEGPKLMIQAQSKAIEDNLRPVRACETNRRTLLAGLAGPFVAGPALLLLAPPSADAKTATVASPVDVVKNVLTQLDDIDTVVAKQSKSVVWKLPAAYPGDPVGGEFKGRYGVLTYMTRHKSYYKDAKMSDLKVTPGDGKDQVIARYRFSGSVASGGKFSTSVTQVWRVDPEGSVTSMKAYYDTASLAKAAGKVVA